MNYGTKGMLQTSTINIIIYYLLFDQVKTKSLLKTNLIAIYISKNSTMSSLVFKNKCTLAADTTS